MREDHDREEEVNDNPAVVAEMTTPVESLTVGEAVMRLDLGDLPGLDVPQSRSWRPQHDLSPSRRQYRLGRSGRKCRRAFRRAHR